MTTNFQGVFRVYYPEDRKWLYHVRWGVRDYEDAKRMANELARREGRKVSVYVEDWTDWTPDYVRQEFPVFETENPAA